MRFLVKCALLVLAMQMAVVAHAQVFRVQAGGSTLLDAEGGSVEFTAPNYDGTLGLGFHDGKFEFGAETRYKFRGYTFLAGDDSVPFNLPTDIFNPSHYFSARGAGVSRRNDEQHFYAFGGTTSTWLGTGFFNSATAKDPVGIFFYERRLNKTLRFVSRDIVSKRQTALQALEWTPSKHLKASVTDGVGSNEKYFASALDAQSSTLALKASYVATGPMFRRVTVTSPLNSEVNKENVELLYKPSDLFSITTGHQNILEPLTPGGPTQEASVNEVMTTFHVEKFYFGAGLFMSQSAGRNSQGRDLYVGRRIGQRFEVNTNYFESHPQGGPSTSIVSAMVRETFSRRFSLLQLVSRSNGQTTAAFGGTLSGNRLNLGVDYQNVYLPFRPDHPFEQALAFNASLRMWGPLQLTAASSVAPDGHIRYSFGLSTYLYRSHGADPGVPPAGRINIPRYIVQGIVKDEKGNPVEGAALHIGREVAYTNSTGHLMVRFTKTGPFPLKLVPDEFITPGIYELVTAPAQVSAATEETAGNIEIVVRRISVRETGQATPKPGPASTPPVPASPISTNVGDANSGSSPASTRGPSLK